MKALLLAEIDAADSDRHTRRKSDWFENGTHFLDCGTKVPVFDTGLNRDIAPLVLA